MKRFKKFLIFLAVIIFVGGIFISGIFVGYSNRPAIEKVTNLYGKEERKPAEVDFSPFWSVWKLIDEKYPANGKKVTDEEKVWGAIEGLVASLGDPYSVFFPPSESKNFDIELKGQFGGVGIEIGIRDEMLTVISPLKGTPAEKAGIKAGDKIIKVDDTSTIKMSLEKAVDLIRGEIGTIVVLTVIRKDNNEPIEIKIVRDTIKIPTLDTEQKENGVFIIKLYNFSAGSTNAFREALREFILSGSDKLILDLRGNPGGFLDAAVEVSSWFLPAGKVVAREHFGEGKEDVLYKSRGYDIFNNLPFVILVDQGSASASEIVAGALKEHGIATLVGEKTFGKGSVQEVVPVTANTSLKITIAKWLTPDGLSISDEGLTPDVEVKITKEDIEAEKDPQLEKAIEILLNK
ncbi:MAG: S41 family peptidase [Parcubacteria group bacterium]|nr:S41 family peptidase [Parcubacteria group bacterium]MCR4342631.1 S41 family peptidase [Patescibacteria group bacterium]